MISFLKKALFPFCRRRPGALLALVVAYPLLFSQPGPTPRSIEVFSWPRITNGDEPHYLTAINSLLRDGDFNLSNNYKAAQEGGMDGVMLLADPVVDGLWQRVLPREIPERRWKKKSLNRAVRPPLAP